MGEHRLTVRGREVRARESGDHAGRPLVYFHGTPGSRFDVGFGDTVAADLGVRVIGFDRPGYGGSTAAPYDLCSIARDVAVLADALEVDRFAVLGWSGGGPFALAAAAELGDRVTTVGVAGTLAPPQQMPGAMDAFTDADRAALAFLPQEPERAAEHFRAANQEMLDGLLAVRDDPEAPWIDWMWGESDPDVVVDPENRAALRSVLREGLRQGVMGICWDNVAWGGPWGFELDDVRQQALVWHGEGDRMVLPANARWLADHLPHAVLTAFPGEGHLLPMAHWPEMLEALCGPS